MFNLRIAGLADFIQILKIRRQNCNGMFNTIGFKIKNLFKFTIAGILFSD